MLRAIAVLYGLLLILLGVVGFLPIVAPNGLLLGAFQVNAMLNLAHIATGLIGIWVGATSALGSKHFFQVFGIVYILIAVLGFGCGDKPLLGVIASNTADAWLHLLIGVVSLYFGFGIGLPKKRVE